MSTKQPAKDQRSFPFKSLLRISAVALIGLLMPRSMQRRGHVSKIHQTDVESKRQHQVQQLVPDQTTDCGKKPQ